MDFRKERCLLLIYKGVNKLYLTYKLNLDRGIIEDEDEFPRYSWDGGKINYEKVVTDSDFSYIEDMGNKIEFGFINGCGIEYNNKELFYTPDFTTYKFGTDISFRTNHKWKVWTGEK